MTQIATFRCRQCGSIYTTKSPDVETLHCAICGKVLIGAIMTVRRARR